MIDLPSQPRRRGFTMIELIIVLVVLGIAIGMAVPSLRGFGANARLRDATQQLVSATRWARAEAAAHAATMRLTLDAGAAAYVVRRQENGDFVDAAGEFGTTTALPSGFTLQLVSGGASKDAVDFYPDLRVTSAVIRITTPTGLTTDVACDYAAGQFKAIDGGTR